MLKACWDCIAGYNANRETVENGGAYGIQLNGDTQRAPPWPDPQFENEIMFVLPRKMNSGDRIDVHGTMMANRQRFTISLITGNDSPDYQNIACQLDAFFPPSGENKLSLKIVQNGYHEEISGEYQSDTAEDWFRDSRFELGFAVSDTGNYGHVLDIFIGPSSLEQLKLKHSIADIRYLALQGDIAKVDNLKFNFA